MVDKICKRFLSNVHSVGCHLKYTNCFSQVFENMVQGERHSWESERQAWDIRALSYLEQQENLELQLGQLNRDRHALRDELENTKALLHKAGLGIRLPVKNVRELSDGDVDLRNTGIPSVPPSRGQSTA